jgi:hypothetical protein
VLDPRLVLLAALLNLVGAASYARDTIRGRTRPNRVTWALWALAPFIGFAAGLSEGVGWVGLMTFMIGFGPLVILVCSFVNPAAHWALTRLDVACGVISLSALALWALSGSGVVAIAFAVLADLVAGVPTVRKAWTDPASESRSVYGCGMASALITLLVIDRWAFAEYAFPVYIALIGGLILVLLTFPGVRPGRGRDGGTPAGLRPLDPDRGAA